MKLETMLEIQSAVDGELPEGRRKILTAQLASDEVALGLHRELVSVRSAIRGNEPEFRVGDTREFYWSQIERKIQSVQPASTVKQTSAAPQTLVWRWLAPMMGISAVIAVVAFLPMMATSHTRTAVAEATTVTFSSEADGITIHWINN